MTKASRLPPGAYTRYYVRFRDPDDGLRYMVVWARTREQSIKEVRARYPHLLASDFHGSAPDGRVKKGVLRGHEFSGEVEAGTFRRSNPATRKRKAASVTSASRVKVYRGRARVSDDGFGNDAYYALEGSRVKVAMANPRAHSWDESGGSDRDGEFILLRTNLRDARAVLEPLGYVVRAFR